MQDQLHSDVVKAWSKPVIQRVGTIAAVAGQNGAQTQAGGGGFKTPS